MATSSKLITIVNRCFECGDSISSTQKLINHLNIHGISTPSRPLGFRRRNNEQYTFVKCGNGHGLIEAHAGCPACSAHYADVKELKDHFYICHRQSLADQHQLTKSRSTAQHHQNNGQNQESSSSRQRQESSHDQEQSSSQQHLNDVHCVTSRTKGRSSTRAEDRSLEMELLDPKDLSFPPVDHDDHFVAQQFNVTNAMYEFQCSILRQKWKLSIEDHIHHAMAINSILLLSPNRYPDNLSPHFCEASLRTTINKIKSIYELNLPRMQIETVTNMISIIQELNIEAISRSQAIVKLLQLDLLPHERKFANGLVELVKKLPRVSIEEDVNESELSARFVDPFLSGLFDDPDEGVFIRWTNKITAEARKNETLWTRRPDLTVTSLKGVKWSTSHGYGEVKPACHEANNYFLSNDLIRVAKFCKNALDAQNLEGILGLQIIGRSITFYLLVLPSKGLYVMYELGTLQLPSNLCDLHKLLMDMPLCLLVLDVFHRLCIRSVNPFQPSRHRPTVSESNFYGIFSTSQDRKRSCHLKKYN